MTDGRWLGLSHQARNAPVVPPHPSYSDLLAPAPPEPRPDLPVEPSDKPKPGEDDEYIYHPVDKKRDTLMGISLKYRVPVDVLKLHNNLPTENIAVLDSVKVPKANARPRATSMGVVETLEAKIRRFTRGEGVSDAEARLYLDDANGDYDLAVAQYKEDLEVERKAGISPTTLEATIAASSVTVHAVPPAAANAALSGSFAGSGSGRKSDNARSWSNRDRENDADEGEGLLSSSKKLGSPQEEDEAVSSGVARSTFDAFVSGSAAAAADDATSGSTRGELRRRATGQPHQ